MNTSKKQTNKLRKKQTKKGKDMKKRTYALIFFLMMKMSSGWFRTSLKKSFSLSIKSSTVEYIRQFLFDFQKKKKLRNDDHINTHTT